MVDPTLTPRPAPPTDVTSSTMPPSRRSRSQNHSLFKHIQILLGPRVATLRNLLLLIIVIQSILIFFLMLTILAKNNALTYLQTPAYTPSRFSHVIGYQAESADHYGRPPPENQRIVQSAIDQANYDDMSPAITGLSEARKFTTLFGKFTRCKPRPCNIDHWPYLGEKCFYRDDHVKDRSGHNSSIWNLVELDWYYTPDQDFPCPVNICRHQWDQEINLTKHIVLRALQEHYSQSNHTVWLVENMYTGSKYMRVNHFWGLEYKLHGFFTLTRVDENGEELVQNKTGTITVRRGFTQKFCDVSVNSAVAPPEEPIYIVVPYTGRVEQLRLFYENLKALLDQNVTFRVILATHGGPVHILGASELLRDMQLGITEGELSDGHLIQVIDAAGDKLGKFSRSKALLDGAMYVPADAIMFYCDVDMIIKPRFFDNCRNNVQRNYQVYYPVVYSLFPYGYKVSKEHGYWRKGAFGMVCGYKSDFKRTKTWEKGQAGLVGWGFEDVMLHQEFSKHWQISVFHAMEPNLLHRWHPKYCEFNLHVGACLGTIFQNMGSQQFLASIVANQGIDVRNIRYDPVPMVFTSYKNDSAGSDSRFLEMPVGESQSDDTKLVEAKKLYEGMIDGGSGGLLSLFAKEAQEILTHATAEQARRAEQKPFAQRFSGQGVASVSTNVRTTQESVASKSSETEGSSHGDAPPSSLHPDSHPSGPIEPDSPHPPSAPMEPDDPPSHPDAPSAPDEPQSPPSDSVAGT